MSVEATDLGWRLGRSKVPVGVELWVPFDRTTGVYGPQGSGKTLDLLTPALLDGPGRGAGHADQARGPATSPSARGRLGGRRCTCSTRSISPPARRSWCGTRSTGARTRWSPNGGPRRSPPAPSAVR